MRKINPELWLLLFLVLISALLNFLAASQRMALVFYFLPTLYSAYYFGRRHATLTAFASVFLVILLTYLNPAVLNRRIDLPFDTRIFDFTVWGGILVITGYAMGTLYERNQKSLKELRSGYDGMLVILQQFLASQKYSEAHAYRVSMYATKIAEALGLNAETMEDVSTAALLHNANELGISNDILYKAANLSQEELAKGVIERKKSPGNDRTMANSLRRAILIYVAEQQLAKTGSSAIEAPVEVQVLAVADAYESLLGRADGRKMSPAQAEEIIVKFSGKKYDETVVEAFVTAFGQQAQGAKVGN